MKIVLEVAAVALIVWILWAHGELSKRRKKEKESWVFLFPRRISPTWTCEDDSLARLVYDYHLSDSEIQRIVKNSVHAAADQYRKDHPLDHRPPSDDLFDAVYPYD